MVSGIYIIYCLSNGKSYVGSSGNVQRRGYEHLRDLRRKHHNPKLLRAVEKYGIAAFRMFLVEVTSDLTNREQYWIDALDAHHRGFNCGPAADNAVRGRPLSAQHRANLSAARIAKGSGIGVVQSKATRQKRALAMMGNTNNLGKSLSVETRAKLSAAMKGKRNSLGSHPSAEARAKMSESRKGKGNCMFGKFGKDHPQFGQKRSPESCARISASKTGKPWSAAKRQSFLAGSMALVAILALCACQKEPKILTLSAEPPKIFATPTPAMTPPVRHVVARPQPTQAPEQVLDQIIESATIQEKRWASARVKPAYQIAVDKAVMLYLRTRDRYETVAAMRSNGVPAPVIFCLHYRESSNSFKCHLHEGSSLSHRTRYVPKGRLPAPDEPPYEWQKSAEDAIYVCDHLQGPWKTVKWSMDKIEGYNGVGYRTRGIPSPYLWAATTVYQSGKYTSDGHFSPSAIDQQLGVCAILKRMKEKGVALPF